jgi:hypothetical protein
MEGEVYIYIADFDGGERDVELFADKPMFSCEEAAAKADALNWDGYGLVLVHNQLRVGNVNGGDSLKIDEWRRDGSN